jgi:hypothetical protein
LNFDHKGVKAVCLNELSNFLYVIDSLNKLSVIQTSPTLRLVKSVSTDGIDDMHIINMTYLVDQECLCVVASEGSIVKIAENGDCEVVAHNEDGIECASWSPSQDHILIVTKNHSLIQLNAEFDLVSEIPLDDAGL